jgi:hypothetical protein
MKDNGKVLFSSTNPLSFDNSGLMLAECLRVEFLISTHRSGLYTDKIYFKECPRSKTSKVIM